MKKAFALILLLALLLTLAACGAPAAPEEPEEEVPVMTAVLPGASQKEPAVKPTEPPAEVEVTAEEEPESNTAETVARILKMKGQPVEDLIEWLGEPISREYSSSCLIDGGQDGQLVYEGFTVYTLVEKDGTETIYDCE